MNLHCAISDLKPEAKSMLFTVAGILSIHWDRINTGSCPGCKAKHSLHLSAENLPIVHKLFLKFLFK